QRGLQAHPAAAGRLDRGDQGPQAGGAVGAHGGGDPRRRRDPDPHPGRRQRPVSTDAAAGAASAPADVPAGPEGDPAWAAATRATQAQADARLAKRFDAGEAADRLVALRARAVDALVREAWRRCIPEAAEGLA